MALRIKLMADYGCWPLWWMGDDGRVGNIDPTTLGLSPNMLERLEQWAEAFDQRSESEALPAAREASIGLSRTLWLDLASALAPVYEVFFYDETTRTLLAPPVHVVG